MRNNNRLPAEWEPLDAVQLTWPHADTDWAPMLAEVTEVYLQLVSALVEVASVLIAAPEGQLATIGEQLAARGVPAERLRLYPAPSDDTWTRDHGPITVHNDAGWWLLDYQFTGWGNKFPAQRDNELTSALYRQGAYPGAGYERKDLVLEGGAIESDGRGTLLTTRQCLLNPNRNPRLDQDQLEEILALDLGVRKFNWLEHGALEGDDTDSHIDTLARLCPDRVIVYQGCDDSGDSHYDDLQAMAAELALLSDVDGAAYTLLPLPWPGAKYDSAGERLPATYANFLVCNSLVLVPTYRDANDAAALAVIAEAFPGYRVQGLDCLPLIQQHGSLHCITMQLPQGVLTND